MNQQITGNESEQPEGRNWRSRLVDSRLGQWFQSAANIALLALIVAGLSFVADAVLVVYVGQQARVAREQAEAAQEQAEAAREQASAARAQAQVAREAVEEQTAPKLVAQASFVRTPVPDVVEYLLRAGPDSAARAVLQQARNIGSALLGSRGVWQLRVDNVGDATAVDARVRVPGGLFARIARFAQGTKYSYQTITEIVDLETIAPREPISVVVWVEGRRHLEEDCTQSDIGCFTKDDLVVWSRDAVADVQFFDAPPRQWLSFEQDTITAASALEER